MSDVLIVAPEINISESSDAVNYISRILSCRVLSGSFGENEIAQEFENRYIGVFFIGHGNQDGFVLESGKIVPWVRIAIYLNASGAKWAAFAACDSDSAFQLLRSLVKCDLWLMSENVTIAEATSLFRLAAQRLEKNNYNLGSVLEELNVEQIGKSRFYKGSSGDNFSDNVQEELSKIVIAQEKTIERLSSLESRVSVQEVLLKEIKSYAHNGSHVYITQTQLVNWIVIIELMFVIAILGILYFLD